MFSFRVEFRVLYRFSESIHAKNSVATTIFYQWYALTCEAFAVEECHSEFDFFAACDAHDAFIIC